jgi:glutathione synthase/RimK-type ligase-like ATP-grasp enzyme
VHVVFATCDQKPLITDDDRWLADALGARGINVEPIPWTEIDPYAVHDAPPILLRSTWDYHRVPTMFVTWLQALADSGRQVWNPAEIARGNVDKIYLRGLEASGIAIPSTRWLDQIDNASIASEMREQRWTRAVLKPRIAATAHGTFLIDGVPSLSDDDLAPARSSGALLQEFVPEIVQRGEFSMVYLDGRFSHAVLNRAAEGEFRVQSDFGGRGEVVTPGMAALAFADRVMAGALPGSLYARIDIVEASRGPLLMELELIEPELFFRLIPEAADRLAQLIAERL